MSEYNFEEVRPFQPERSVQLQKIIARNYGPRVGVGLGPNAGRLRNARFDLGGSIPQGYVQPPPPPGPGPGPGPVLPPAGTHENPLFVASNHYGGQVLVFNFQGATPGGGGNNEIRVSQYLEVLHLETKAIRIVPYSGVTAGQFLQVLKSNDDDIVNTAFPSGSNVGVTMGRVGSYPAPDNERGIAIPTQEALIDTFRVGWSGGSYIKLRLYFVAPAIALPVISVLIPITYRYQPGAYLFAVRS